VKEFADLRGKRVATTAGTTAHVFLDNALRENKMTGADIDLASMPMPDAVQFVHCRNVPAVVLWVPFNIAVREKVPQAKKLLDAACSILRRRWSAVGRRRTPSTLRTSLFSRGS